MGNFIGKGTVSLFGFLGAIVLLLLGIRMIRKGVESVLLPFAKGSSPIFHNKFYALLSGMFGAAFLQSSTALVLIVSSVATKISIPTATGLAFVLGADVGTSIAAQLFTFKIHSAGPVLLFVGFILQRNYRKEHLLQRLGQVFLGFGLVLYALSNISTISQQMRDSEVLSNILSILLVNDVVLALFIAVLLTWLAHSSLAIVLMTIELVVAGVVPVNLGLALILGANIGACFPAYIDSLGEPVEARRLTLGNVIFRISGGLVALPFLSFFSDIALNSTLPAGRFLALSHLVFNVANGMFFIFLTKPVANLIERMLPIKETLTYKGVDTKFLRVEESQDPKIAIDNLTKETLRLSDTVYVMIGQISRSIQNKDEIASIEKNEHAVDSIYRSITKYLQGVYQTNLSSEESFSAMLTNSYCTDLEQIADIISNTFTECLLQKHKSNISVSDEHQNKIESLCNQLIGHLNMSQEIFRTRDKESAEKLVAQKESFKAAITQESIQHKKHVLEGNAESVAINNIYLDMLNYMRSINSHITAVAYPVIDNTGFETKH